MLTAEELGIQREVEGHLAWGRPFLTGHLSVYLLHFLGFELRSRFGTVTRAFEVGALALQKTILQTAAAKGES